MRTKKLILSLILITLSASLSSCVVGKKIDFNPSISSDSHEVEIVSSLSGHIKEEKVFTFGMKDNSEYETTTPGEFNLTVEYDFEGTVFEKDREINGSMSFTNITASLSCSAAICRKESGNEVSVVTLNPFSEFDPIITNEPSYTFTGTLLAGRSCQLNTPVNTDDILSVSGKGFMNEDVSTDGGEATRTQENEFSSHIEVTNAISLLLFFIYDEGNYTNTSTSFKDTFIDTYQMDGVALSISDRFSYEVLSENSKTTQNIVMVTEE